MSTTPAGSEQRPSETAADFLAVLSIVASALALAYQPVKLIPFAVLLALIATGMAPRDHRLPLVAVFVAAACFVAGMTIAVLTRHSLY